MNKNFYRGKKISVLGDSISTLDGYNPKGYKLFYTGEKCEISGVKEYKDTWWGKVIDHLGGELLVNNSWSGSRVTRMSDTIGLFPSGCSDERTFGLHSGTVFPDVIIVYMGTNDWKYGAAIDGMSVNDNAYSSFERCCGSMIAKIKSNYQNAEIWCATLGHALLSPDNTFSFPGTNDLKRIRSYCKVIEEKSKITGCNIVDLYASGIQFDSFDGTHPTKDGMDTLASAFIKYMTE